jgi:hypothetical protein
MTPIHYSFVIASEQSREKARFVLEHAKLDKPLFFELTEYEPSRSNDQNRLMWKHYDNMFLEGMGAGTPLMIHEDHKRRLLIPLLESLKVKSGPIKEWQDNLAFARKEYLEGEEYRAGSRRMEEFLYSLVSTSWLSVSQMTRYLEIIETETMPLPKKEDMK